MIPTLMVSKKSGTGLDISGNERIRTSRRSPHDSVNVPDAYALAADFFLFFSDPATLIIFDRIREKEMTAAAIASKTGIPIGKVRKTLLEMEREGLLVSHTRLSAGKYRVPDSRFTKSFNRILQIPRKQLLANDPD